MGNALLNIVEDLHCVPTVETVGYVLDRMRKIKIRKIREFVAKKNIKKTKPLNENSGVCQIVCVDVFIVLIFSSKDQAYKKTLVA
ncbi:MAG: hypothetical protein J7574_16615 [Flavobacterium sp.]|uniref:hypothetical protein n=1 Tax=Flavobacterium sp. TaxID=239 RepID=UPI001B1FBD96|nr:hypothetical protein [Flavobacterium sp.]MBO9585789.1 hypothetical protein [Flavobacterium sp.]